MVIERFLFPTGTENPLLSLSLHQGEEDNVLASFWFFRLCECTS